MFPLSGVKNLKKKSGGGGGEIFNTPSPPRSASSRLINSFLICTFANELAKIIWPALRFFFFLLLFVMKKWYVYLTKCRDESLYFCITTDVVRRISEHNSGHNGAKYTRTRRPVKLIYSASYDSRSEAQKAEYRFKKQTRKQKETFINESR